MLNGPYETKKGTYRAEKMNKNEIDDIQFYISTLIQVESSKPER